MRRACFLEVPAGALVLLLGSTAAFVLSGGHYAGAAVMLFVVVSTLLLMAVASVLILRLLAHDRRVAQRLYQQLPAEVACRLNHGDQYNRSADELVRLLGQHLQSQQKLLDEHYQGLFSQHVPGAESGGEPSESENTWQQLRSELSALEDQFATDRLRFGPDTGDLPAA